MCIRTGREKRKREERKAKKKWRIRWVKHLSMLHPSPWPRLRERERAREKEMYEVVTYTRAVCERALYVRYRAFQRHFPWNMGSAGQSGTLPPSLSLSLSLALSVPQDLLITLESECSLELRLGERERKREQNIACAAQPPGNSQRLRRPDVIYTARLVLSRYFSAAIGYFHGKLTGVSPFFSFRSPSRHHHR